MNMLRVEEEYVQQVYSRLAAYSNTKEAKPTSPRVWPRIRQFLEELNKGSVVVDIGCGEGKYRIPGGVILGVDTCADLLVKVPRNGGVDYILADGLELPFRRASADAALCVSVLHHFSTELRRRDAMQQLANVLRPGGKALVYVWAFEQPNGTFPSQDVLVPWNLHETALNGRLPKVKFHKESTKEQRIIQSSIAVEIVNDEAASCPSPSWFSSFVERFRLLRKPSLDLPPAAPSFNPTPRSSSTILTGIRKWSPMLGKRLASLLIPVEEQLADEMTQDIMQTALQEALATLRKVTFYRFYHVFKKGELEALISSIPQLKVLSSQFEHGNWCILAEKVPDASKLRVI
ncbi:unnamed protein product, partial [Mesorhabditis belari]|uniref:Methyltransferase type 11 domain-containing protein n=1 Tax=Mesorhabditis belari TaxID=2138241 RepID=A0AAF3E9H4_9BILA